MHFRVVLRLAALTLIAVSLFGQPVAPGPEQIAILRAMSQIDLRAKDASTPLTVNIAAREETRQFYRAIYSVSNNVPSAWTGSYATGTAGDTSAAFKAATLLRINYFRAMAGVPAGIVLNSTFSAEDQQAALMMSANNTLQHTGIPTTWTFYTAAGADAAANSNLAIGNSGPDAITAYMDDDGSNNSAVGHRRWLVYPQTREMGTGDVPGDGVSLSAANATWIIDSQVNAARPATRTTQVTYPPAGFVPYQLVWPRWSFAYPNADFSAATVTMSSNGQPVAVKLETLSTANEGEPTLVWVYNGLDSTLPTTHPKPAVDTTYTVTVNNVKISGAVQNFSYNVTVFDPDVAGSDFVPTAVSGPATPGIGVANAYTVAKPSFAGSFDWRTLQLAAYAKIYGAENGLDGLIATTSAGYNVVQSIAVGAGGASYRLTHPSPFSNQTLLMPETFFVSSAGAAVNFLSRLGIATSIEVARVQISTDDGNSWIDAFTQTGASDSNTSSPASNDATFVSRSVSLAAYVGRTVRVQLAFTIDPSGTAFVPNATNTVGWFIDNLSVTGVQSATASAATNVAGGTGFSFAPAVTGPVGLQARGVLFGSYPLEWGPVAQVTAADNGGIAAGNARITNLSILTTIDAPPADNFTLGYVVGNASASTPLSLVIRAAGPSLGALGYPGTMADPQLALFAGSTPTGGNDNWGGTAALKAAFTSVGAFPYVSDTSKDAAALGSITTSNNSVKITAADGGTGAVIAEVYDATPAANFSPSGPRLINVSVIKPIGPSLTVGFVIGGTGTKRVLIRASGPALVAFGFPTASVIADPKLQLFDSTSTSIATNDNWGGTAALTAAFTAAGAFSFDPNSLDAALTAALAPGNYTVVVSPSTGATGTGLVEVYELP